MAPMRDRCSRSIIILLLLSRLDVWYQKRHFVVVDPHFLLALGPERPLQPVEPHERIPERTPPFLDFGLWNKKKKKISYDLHNSVCNAINEARLQQLQQWSDTCEHKGIRCVPDCLMMSATSRQASSLADIFLHACTLLSYSTGRRSISLINCSSMLSSSPGRRRRRRFCRRAMVVVFEIFSGPSRGRRLLIDGGPWGGIAVRESRCCS